MIALPFYDATLPSITPGVKSIPFNKIIRNLENRRPYPRVVGLSTCCSTTTAANLIPPGIESAALVGDTGGSINLGRLT
ncbi:hypothetical protein HFO45_33865 [Rhizobium leguminosarum]|uniref:hypothetical protein n=1 Tax=Rhizobium leguminosarum TaxID=384 RepID=UPI001C9435BE|nr:hypothetical protein [Rhizobium leguminosarum]MBY5653154.1 hypothetical protein [Rhizobium leguminosarum]